MSRYQTVCHGLWWEVKWGAIRFSVTVCDGREGGGGSDCLSRSMMSLSTMSVTVCDAIEYNVCHGLWWERRGRGSDCLSRSVMPLSTMSVTSMRSLSTMSVTSVMPLLRCLSRLRGHWVQCLSRLWGHSVQRLSRSVGGGGGWWVQISTVTLQHFLSVRVSQNSCYFIIYWSLTGTKSW